MRRAVATLMTLVMGLTVLAAIPVLPGSTAGASVFTERPVYGRNQAVTITGAITYTPQCATGVRDWLYAIADIYVVPAGGGPSFPGTPNTVFGAGGGGIFDEVIAYTKPGGALGPGTYSIVIDECQDKSFGPEDTYLPNAFRVVSNVVGPQLPDIAEIKAQAAVQAERYDHAVLAWKALLALSGKGQGSAGKAYGYFFKITNGLGAPNPAAIATLYLGNQGRHYAGIAADPPDPTFAQPTALAPTNISATADPEDPVDVAAADAVGPLATSAALTGGLLRSLERYQGAWSARDGEWQLAHARDIQAHAGLMAEQVLIDAEALDDLADALDDLPEDVDAQAAADTATLSDFLADAPTPAEVADLANQGTTDSIDRAIRELRDELDGFAISELVGALRDIADDAPEEAALLDALAEDMQPVIDALEADPFVEGTVPVASAGGPYEGTVGSDLSLDATASTGAGTLTYAWDLDGDGAFDDAEGASPTVAPAVPFDGLVAVRVTGGGGEVDIAYAPLAVVGGPAAPTITDPQPTSRNVEMAAGTTLPFSIVAGGDSPAVSWHLDGVEVATDASFGYSPTIADAGPHRVEVLVTDAVGRTRSRTWFVSVTAPDADADLYWAHVDCDDTVATTYPGAPELLDGVDNDCAPSTPDGGVAPVVPAVATLTGPEGTTLEVVRSFTHPSGTYSATVDWGDGTVTPGTITSKTVRASHAYADDGVYTVEVCVTATLGKTGCNTGTATISNVAAGPRFSTLFDWTEQETHPNNGVWTVAPDGLSVFQSVNGDPSWFMADTELAPGVEAGVNITVETGGDDDYIGFALGLQPDFALDPDADFLLVDWKQSDQGFGGCNGDFTAEEGLALSRVTGTPPFTDIWPHTDCSDTDGGGVDELARGATRGHTGWGDNTQYRFRFRYSPARVQVWVDDVLEFDLTGTFPPGRLGFYNYSQSDVRYSGYQLVPGDVVEGTPRDFAVDFADPGTADTHTGLISWGDGTPNDNLVITEADGEGTGRKDHNYLEDGTFDGEVCLTDDDGATGCQQFPIDVANAAPDVIAGRDRVSGPQVELDDTSFVDPGVLDTHTATVDWGDGSPVVDAAVAEDLGEGIVTDGHTYTDGGTYEVEVCVTDDEGDTGCDHFDVEVRIGNGAPVAETDPDIEITEGDLVARSVAFTDTNPDDSHTATVDWGDGSAPETVTLQSNGQIGSGGTTHRFVDDGEHQVTVEVCDDEEACDTATSVVTVLNAPPAVDASGRVVDGSTSGGNESGAGSGGGPGTGNRSLPVEVEATFTDVGVDDTHTATVDWGDGGEPQVVAVDQDAGSGSLDAGHTYAEPGTYEIEVCVTDDDEGTTCDTVILSPGGQPPGPPLDVSGIGGDGNARVRWNAPLDDGGSPLLQYEIETTPGGATVTVAAALLVTVVGDLDNDTDYTFRVRASNAYGWGPWSLPSNLTRPRPSCPGAIFADVGPSHPFCPEIKWMADTGVSVGFPGNTYRPDQSVTRQQMAAFSYRLLNPGTPAPPCTTKPFTDVNLDNPLCGEIAWMKAEGISTGRPDGSYGAREPVSRQAMAAFLHRLTAPGSGPAPACIADEFPDVPASHVFCGEIDWLVDNGITGGFDDGTFRPGLPVARQQMAAFIFRYNILTGFITGT
jgi:hypothetical protein